MILTVTYPQSGRVWVRKDLTQPQINKLLTNLSDLQDTVGEVPVRATVTEDVLAAATRLDFHAGEGH